MAHNSAATLETQAAEMGINKAGLGNKEPSLLFFILGTIPPYLGILKPENFIFQAPHPQAQSHLPTAHQMLTDHPDTALHIIS